MSALINTALQLGKWRYFITGAALALLLWVFCKTIGALLEPSGNWRVFRASCLSICGDHTFTVSFQDSHRVMHRAAFRSEHPAAETLREGAPLRIAVRKEVFSAGMYPETAEQAAAAGKDILLYPEYRSRMRKELLRIAAKGLLLCAAALVLFLVAMRFCFPPRV